MIWVSYFFWGLPPLAAGLCRSSLFARPFGAFSALVWPNGHCYPSLGLRRLRRLLAVAAG
ncbi:hypothetical protein SGRA_3565 [Saprospira grandis str. Lewin]|uniref:Uncharacterized protein n=1 Tax=Saprospira grandis (strain Lewin) TaxID=984262 RepID=H6L5N9_SAPGL|nr:hypothetical protein SGRA_3565 [Saprospira grandis str. Lewin]